MANIAYCGLNCDACCFRVAALERDPTHLENIPERYAWAKAVPIEELELCPGCKQDEEPKPCPMRDCAKPRGYSTCAECPEMPCEKLSAFCGDAAPHHAAVIENLKRIREIGEEKWAKEQELKWTCGCGRRLSWYRAECMECSKGQSE